MSIGRYPSLMVTGPRCVKASGGYLLGYVFPSAGGAGVVSFREGTMTGTEIWRDTVPATTGTAARYQFEEPLYFTDALYVTGANWPSKFPVAFM